MKSTLLQYEEYSRGREMGSGKKKKSIEIRIGMEKEIKFEAQMVPDTRTLHELLSV